jgi:hypothetical protein
MKRLSVLGLCVVASFTFSVLGASSAFAKKAEHGELVLAASGGPAHLGTPKATITSTNNTGTANVTSGTGGTAINTFDGVEIEKTGLKCNSAGKTGGVVETKLLSEGTGWINKAKQEAGVDFKAASGEFLAEFACEGGLSAKVRASVIGAAGPINTSALSGNLVLTQGGSGLENTPEKFEGGTRDVLESETSATPGTFFTSVQVQSDTISNHGNASVCKLKKGVPSCKPTNWEMSGNGATPEFGRCDKKGAGTKYSDTNCTVPAAKGKYGFVPVPG